MSIKFSLHSLNFRNQWILATILIFVAHFIVGLLVVMSLNGKWLNHALAPIFQYTGMFSLIWQEQPVGALQFIATKSLFAFAHNDPRSGLNLWTLEYDSITLFLYMCASIIAAWSVLRFIHTNKTVRSQTALAATLLGVIFLSFSVSYMTVIEHCSGATWVGFVALYGMGFDEFELYPAYQFISAIIGISALTAGLIQLLSAGKQPRP